MWFNNLAVSFKVLICCLVFLSIISVLAVQSYLNANAASAHFNEFYHKEFLSVRLLNRTIRNILQRRVNMLQIEEAVKTGDKITVKERLESSEALGKENEELWNKYISTVIN